MRSRSPRVVVEPVAADWHNSMRISDPPQGTGDMSFVIRGVMPGAYDLSVQVLGAAVVKSVRIDGLEHATTPFDVTSTNIDNVVVTLSGKLPTLSGAVRDGDGRPSDRALVVAFPSDRTMWPRLGLMPERAKVESTATNGTFALSNLPAGEFFVVAIDANDADRWPTPALLEQLAPFATRVSLTWGDTQTVDLKVTVIK
jgi:hypothetical protein